MQEGGQASELSSSLRFNICKSDATGYFQHSNTATQLFSARTKRFPNANPVVSVPEPNQSTNTVMWLYKTEDWTKWNVKSEHICLSI